MKIKAVIGFAAAAALLVWTAVSFYPDWLWFTNLNFSSVFWPSVISKIGFGVLIWLVFIMIVFSNLRIAHRLSAAQEEESPQKQRENGASARQISTKTLNSLFLILILISSFFVAAKGSKHWSVVLSYLYQQPFGSVDPLFGKDIGFYVFSLPLHLVVQNGLLLIFLFAGLLIAMWYMKDGVLQFIEDAAQEQQKPLGIPKISIAPGARKHLLFIGGLIVLLFAWGYYLKVFGLLYSTQGPAFGASYTDVHVRVLGFRILIFLSLGWAVLLLMEPFKSRGKLIWIGGAVWFGAIVLFSTVIPVMIQKFVVKPNELTKEAPYIAYNIEHTRKAYNLNKIKEVDFFVSETLSREEINRHQGTIRNIRIWDERPLLQTYRQIQAIRLYYDFHNVDVDRYSINDEYRQVMLAAREMVVNQLPAQANTWVNRHLIYTHGIGLASSPVNEVTREGLPQLLVKDLPPDVQGDLAIKRPEIYYGERTDEYVLTRTRAKEFDYPKGDKNVYTVYQGKGGVVIGSFIRRLLYAIEFLDPQILFTNYLTPESRIMYNRRLDRRVSAIAPFLDYDGDPYLVIAGGRLYWVLDAYTTSNMYPYSLRSYTHFRTKGVNYIRNSVKVTIDAYNGDVAFYRIDEKDPILRTYARIFPKLFKPMDEMPDDLKAHLRYPKDLFELQSGTYRTYHMEDVQVFYNQEDLWQIPDEIYGDSRQVMKPYYIIITLPGEKKEEFLLMLPFTPSRKDNMIGWLAARSDLPHYGNLLVYKLPKEKLVYGPMQIEARVDQQTEISRELSLWDQRGSRVIRGNMLAIPIGDTFVYIEPVYLEAKQEQSAVPEQSAARPGRFGRRQQGAANVPRKLDNRGAAALPELKRVIAAFGNHVVMAEDLETALSRVIERKISLGERVVPESGKKSDIFEMSNRALEHYTKAREALMEGDWTGYGRELEHLEKILKEMTVLRQKTE